jgi:hypothetical protein
MGSNQMILPFSGSRKQSKVKRMTLKRLVIELCLVVKERRKVNGEKERREHLLSFVLMCKKLGQFIGIYRQKI